MEVSGTQEIQRDLARLGGAGERVAKRVLGDVAPRIVARARPDTPVEEDGGFLRDSIRSTKPVSTQQGKVVSVSIVAGGDPLAAHLAETHHQANVYAVVQHDDVTLHHEVGGPKFIERHVTDEAQGIPDALRAGIDAEVGA